MLSKELLRLTRNQYRLLLKTIQNISGRHNRVGVASQWATLLEANPKAHPWFDRKKYNYMLRVER